MIDQSSDPALIEQLRKELKTAREEIEREREKHDRFLDLLGHELRNPLAAIRTAVEVLKLTLGDDPRVKRTSGILDRQSVHLVKLLEGMIELARISRGRLRLEKSSLDVAQLLEDVLLRAGPELAGAGLRVETAIARPVLLMGDRTRLSHVFESLLAHAIKSRCESGTLRVSLETDGADAIIRFADDGAGIEPQLLPGIFEPFPRTRADGSRGGLGFGLALVRGLIELHGGTASAKSDGADLGTEFELRIPAPGTEDQAQ